MPKVFIAIGSNLGDRSAMMDQAVQKIKNLKGIRVTGVSSILETDPVGGRPQGKYLNMVLAADSDLTPQTLLNELLGIERSLGRNRSGEKNAPRTIDLDLIFFGDQIIQDAALTIPHPRMHERYFVLKPLSELAPDFVHSVLGKTVEELLEEVERNKMNGRKDERMKGR